MVSTMNMILQRYKHAHRAKYFYWKLAFALMLFAGSLIINYCANGYALAHASNPVSDILLDNIAVVNVSFLYFWGPITVGFFVLLLLLYSPNKIPFTLESIAFIVIMRSFFMIMTHVGAPLNESIVPIYTPLEKLLAGSGDDLFFSGHTAFPFLMALLFWKDVRVRVIFLATTVLFAGMVIAGHLHYSIDVFAAFFIVYGTLHLAVRSFARDYALFTLHDQEP